MFDGMWDDGTANVSGLTLEMDTFFSALTIRDFVERKDSQYTLSGDKFNILPPSIQNPATSCVNGIGFKWCDDSYFQCILPNFRISTSQK